MYMNTPGTHGPSVQLRPFARRGWHSDVFGLRSPVIREQVSGNMLPTSWKPPFSQYDRYQYWTAIRAQPLTPRSIRMTVSNQGCSRREGRRSMHLQNFFGAGGRAFTLQFEGGRVMRTRTGRVSSFSLFFVCWIQRLILFHIVVSRVSRDFCCLLTLTLRSQCRMSNELLYMYE